MMIIERFFNPFHVRQQHESLASSCYISVFFLQMIFIHITSYTGIA